MNLQKLTALGAECQLVADGLLYASTQVAMPFYGSAIGGYIQELGNQQVRISDNADTLFEAIAHGVEHSPNRIKQLKEVVGRFGIELTEAGELATVCKANEVDYFFIRFVEASFAVANSTLDWHPAVQKAGVFRQEMDGILTGEYQDRVTKNVKLIGSSGHQLTFHFVIDFEQPKEKLIQTISSINKCVDWANVYGTLGKMLDISRISNSKRFIIIEETEDDDLANASSLLSEKATVIPYSNPQELLKALAA